MARVAAHGTEIGTIYGLTDARRFMSDRHILRNTGFGWKLFRKLKDGIDPQAAFDRAQIRNQEQLAARPALNAYQKALHDLAGLSKRWKLHRAIALMPDDVDGVWSEVCDGYGDNIHADIDELRPVCNLYKAAVRESADLKSAVLEAA